MQHSNTTVSNYLNELYEANEIIQNSLLIGEQCALIDDAARLYNGLRELITPEYLTYDEFHWMKQTGQSWNDITRSYNKALNDNGMQNDDMHDNMQDLHDALDHLLDDLRDMGDDIGPMET